MYLHSKSVGNKTIVAETPADSNIALQTAIARADIIPYFQPLVNLRSGRIAGFEMLARWQHRVQGLVLPDQFIPTAEDTGLIVPLTDQLLARACASAAKWPGGLTLSVNLSPHLLHDRSLPKRLWAIAKESGFPFARLVFEVTESALIGNLDLALPIVEELKALGAQLALDDFGTGFSSLHHLHALPFDEIKIDASFVRSMVERRSSRKIVAGVIGLGHSLELATVAEGIETAEQAHLLANLGADIGQGWLFGGAIPAEAITPALVQRQWMPPQMPSLPLATEAPAGIEALPGQNLAQLRAIYHGVPLGLAFLDRSLRYVSINQRLADMHGLPIAAHLGRRMADVLPELYQQLGSRVEAALAGVAFSDLEVVGRDPRKPGHDFVTLTSYWPARDEAGEIQGVIAAVADITSHRRAERALHHAEKLSMIGRLTSGVAHDFNNLLTVIRLNVETVTEDLPRADPLQTPLTAALDAADLGAGLTGQLLTLARQHAQEPQATDVDVIIARMQGLAALALGRRHVLHVKPQRNRRHQICHVDPVQLATALLNLIVNARDAMPDGGAIRVTAGSVELTAAQAARYAGAAPGPYVAITVSDEGHGMPKAVLDQALEPFFTTKPAHEGTGLGLSMVHDFVKRCHGQLALRSVVGKGTTVKLLLPAYTAVAPKPGSAAAC